MANTYEQLEVLLSERANGRCEHTHEEGNNYFNKHQVRCSEKVGEFAKLYKGRVTLSMVSFGKKEDMRPEKLRMFCWYHASEQQRNKMNSKIRFKKRRKIKGQTDLFGGE